MQSKIIKVNNKSDNFYNYMGKYFGSRVVQNKTNDRIYDDSNKDWYILLRDDKSVAFVSLVRNTIKNLYATKDDDLVELLNVIEINHKIEESIVPRAYINVYNKSKFNVIENGYKNFVLISSKRSKIK